MNSEILVNVTPQETRVAVIEQGVVQELHIERTSSCGIVGNIYNGRVTRVLPGMQSAFMDIGWIAPPFCTWRTSGECVRARMPISLSKGCCTKEKTSLSR